MHFLLIILEKGKVTDVICCANGTDSSHTLVQGKNYQILDIDKLRLDKKDDWLTPKVYHPSEEENE